MPLPEYKYGKVTGTFPDLRVVSERSESPMVCCGYCSAHMAAITARSGLSDLMKNEAHAIRKAGGRPHNHGSKASELRAGTKEALGVTLLGVSIEDIPERLRKGFAVEAAIQYADLPAWLKVQANDFGHSVTLFGWLEDGNRCGFFDPLWSQDARGAWVPWTSVKRALWASGNHNTTTVRLTPPGGGGSDVGIHWNPTTWEDKGVPLYLDSECKVKVTDSKPGGVLVSLGPRAAQDGNGYDTDAYSIVVTTSHLLEGTSQRAILWAKRIDLPESTLGPSQAWDDSLWALANDQTGRFPCVDDGSDELAARQAQYDADALVLLGPRPG